MIWLGPFAVMPLCHEDYEAQASPAKLEALFVSIFVVYSLNFYNSIPLMPKNKNEDIGNYNKKYSKFFEEFYIVGVDKVNLSTINNEKDVIRPSLLYKHTNGTLHKDRDCVIKDFCFPSGIQVQEINLSKPEFETTINEVIFSRQMFRKSHTPPVGWLI